MTLSIVGPKAAALSGRLLVLWAALAVPMRLGAQDGDSIGRAPSDTGPRLVAGEVLRPSGDRMQPVAGLWVVLHRVGSDTAGPVDSVRTGRDGSYRFRYRAAPGDEALWFVSASYAGIAYFSPPLRAAEVTGEEAQVTVFDTTSATVPLRARGRHIVVSAAQVDGSREIIEVYELSNDTTLTAISADDRTPTWSAAVPSSAGDFRVGQGDVSPEAIAHTNGRVVAIAPFAPGVKQLSFAYRLPGVAFPLSIPVEGETDVLEVLVEDPTGAVQGAGLAEVDPVTVDGRTFKRFLAQNAPASGAVRIDVATSPSGSRTNLYVAIVAIAFGAAMLVALAASFKRRGRPSIAVPATHAPLEPDGPAEQLARAIADLDAALARDGVGDAERAEQLTRRAELKRRLAAALAAERRGA
ncbi:MAG TPA: hypothetical protein VJ803_07605 [Gemmatimonadaceae bacterium]|nr:hypothetical protein [Gemmatimonadaceae bacterium]